MALKKQNEISAYKAKVTIRDNKSVNYNAVYNAVRAPESTKKELMRQVTRNDHGGYQL